MVPMKIHVKQIFDWISAMTPATFSWRTKGTAEILRRIKSDDPDERMPPNDSKLAAYPGRDKKAGSLGRVWCKICWSLGLPADQKTTSAVSQNKLAKKRNRLVYRFQPPERGSLATGSTFEGAAGAAAQL